MAIALADLRLSELCTLLGKHALPAELDGDDHLIRAVNTLEDAGKGELTFLSNPKYLSALKKTRASAVIVKDGLAVPRGLAAVRCGDPYAGLTVAIVAIHGHRRHPQWGVSDRAQIDPTARVGANANIAGGATISANVIVGDDCTIYPGCYLADGVRIGRQCILYPNVVIYDHCVLGDRATIHAGSVVGQDGLGYAPQNDQWVKIPQVGRTIIGDDVEIGANCAIDRATLGTTRVGDRTKFGNVVVIGHGTKIGPDCLFVGQVGVAGSVTIGRHVTLAGQVGVKGHLTIGDDVRVGAQSAIYGDVEPKVEMLGSPALPIENAKRSIYAFQKLPDWINRIKALEREIAELREQLGVRDEAGS